MDENTPYCRFCQDPLPQSAKPIKCPKCAHSSLPITEKAISITPREVKDKLSKKEEFVFLDVRWPHEIETAQIKGTIKIPLNELENRIEELPKDKEIVIHCRTGGRSRFAAITLLCHGYPRVKNMVGGINQWSKEIDPSIAQY